MHLPQHNITPTYNTTSGGGVHGSIDLKLWFDKHVVSGFPNQSKPPKKSREKPDAENPTTKSFNLSQKQKGGQGKVKISGNNKPTHDIRRIATERKQRGAEPPQHAGIEHVDDRRRQLRACVYASSHGAPCVTFSSKHHAQHDYEEEEKEKNQA